MVEIILMFQLALPNPKLTPGVATGISVENLCPETKVLTQVPPIVEATRDKVLLNYGLLNSTKSYYIDILIPLELGGQVSLKNLWPIPYETRRDTIMQKTALEHKLHELVCNGELTLKQAQNEIRNNWTTSYDRYFGPKQ